jgi:hypothetical protein
MKSINTIQPNYLSTLRIFSLVSIATLSLIATVGPVQAEENLCKPNERIVYNCKIKNSHKVASLCASKKLTEDEGYLQYRFGTAKKIELTYPEKKQSSLQQFTISHYFRSMVDRTWISFENGGYEYTYSSDFDGGQNPPLDEVGISVHRKGNKKSTRLVCVGENVTDISIVEGILP